MAKFKTFIEALNDEGQNNARRKKLIQRWSTGKKKDERSAAQKKAEREEARTKAYLRDRALAQAQERIYDLDKNQNDVEWRKKFPGLAKKVDDRNN